MHLKKNHMPETFPGKLFPKLLILIANIKKSGTNF